MSEEKKMLTVQEVASRLDLAVQTVRKSLIYTGLLPATRIGDGKNSPVRVDEEDLEAFIASRRITATDK